MDQSLAPVAPIIASLLKIHPWLSTLRGVDAALRGIALRYQSRLRTLEDHTPPELDSAEIQRALLFLMNTARPLQSDPTVTTVDLFVVATAEIMRSGRSVPEEAKRAARAFELAIARIVHVARASIVRR